MKPLKFEVEFSDDAVVLAEPPFVVVMARRELRTPAFELRNPPLLFVTCYSPQYDQTTLRPVDWVVAETLAPKAISNLGDRLCEMRTAAAKAAFPKQTEG